jgi:hypothetical protein
MALVCSRRDCCRFGPAMQAGLDDPIATALFSSGLPVHSLARRHRRELLPAPFSPLRLVVRKRTISS